MRKSALFIFLLVWSFAFSACELQPRDISITDLELTPTTIELEVDQSFTLDVTVTPEDATEEYVFSSSDTTVVTVSETGVITAVGPGVAVVTVEAETSDVSASIDVTVLEPDVPVEGVNLDVDYYELDVEETATLVATIVPENATNQDVQWSVDDAQVVSIDQEGSIEGLALGKTVVTVTTDDGDFEAEATIAVVVMKMAEVEDALDALPSVEHLTLDDEGDVHAVRDKYNLLTEDQKSRFTDIETLNDLEDRLIVLADEAEAQSVSDMIDALPEVEALSLDDEAAIVAAREAFDALTPAQQAMVDNEGDLIALEQALEDLETALAVQHQIEDLPALEDVSIADAAAIAAVRDAYDALTVEEKAFVTNIDVLENLESMLDVMEALAQSMPATITPEDEDLELLMNHDAVEGDIVWVSDNTDIIGDSGEVDYHHAYQYVAMTATFEVATVRRTMVFDVFVSDAHVGFEGMHAMPQPDDLRSVWMTWYDRYWTDDYTDRTVAGQSFEPYLYHSVSYSNVYDDNPVYIVYDISDRHYARVYGYAGISDYNTFQNNPLTYRIYGDDVLLYEAILEFDEPAKYYNVDVEGVETIRFEWFAEVPTGGGSGNRIVWTEPQFVLFDESIVKRDLQDGLPEAVHSGRTEGDLTLMGEHPFVEHGITWSSSHVDVINLDGEIVYPEETTVVTLTASYEMHGETFDLDIEIVVLAEGIEVLQVGEVRDAVSDGDIVWVEGIVLGQTRFEDQFRERILQDKQTGETIYFDRYFGGPQVGVFHTGDWVLLKGQVSINTAGGNLDGKLEIENADDPALTEFYHLERNNPFRYGFDDDPTYAPDAMFGAIEVDSHETALDVFEDGAIFGTFYKFTGEFYIYVDGNDYSIHFNSEAEVDADIRYGDKKLNMRFSYQEFWLGDDWVEELLGIDDSYPSESPNPLGIRVTGTIVGTPRWAHNDYWQFSILYPEHLDVEILDLEP